MNDPWGIHALTIWRASGGRISPDEAADAAATLQKDGTFLLRGRAVRIETTTTKTKKEHVTTKNTIVIVATDKPFFPPLK